MPWPQMKQGRIYSAFSPLVVRRGPNPMCGFIIIPARHRVRAPTRPPSVSGGAKRTVTRRTARAAPAGRLFDSAWGRMRTGFWWCLDASCRLSTAKTAPLRVRVELF